MGVLVWFCPSMRQYTGFCPLLESPQINLHSASLGVREAESVQLRSNLSWVSKPGLAEKTSLYLCPCGPFHSKVGIAPGRITSTSLGLRAKIGWTKRLAAVLTSRPGPSRC